MNRQISWPSTSISIQDVVASGAAGGVATADDAVSGVSIVAIQGGLHVAPGEDELVHGRHCIWLTNLRDVIENYCVGVALNVFEVGGITKDPGVMDDVHRGVSQGDVDDLKGAVVAVEKQPRVVIACAGQVETQQGATSRADAEGVRNSHVTTAGFAVGVQP